MDLLAYWRYDNYLRDLDEGAGYNYNSRQHRFHTEIDAGERLWLFTGVKGPTRMEYRLAARLTVAAKTLNAPDYKYGPYRIWGDPRHSRYFRVDPNDAHDLFPVLAKLPLASGTLASLPLERVAQACQSVRGLTPAASEMLEAFARVLPEEPRAHSVVDEQELEAALDTADAAELERLLVAQHTGASANTRRAIIQSRQRHRQLVEDLHRLYDGRCQVTGFDSPLLYGVPTAEAHHLVYRSRGGQDELSNLVLLSPTIHMVVHRTNAAFDYHNLAFVFPNGRVEPLVLNRHLTAC